MIYPKHLLPQVHYKEEIVCNDELQKCFLIRHTDTKDVFFEGTSTINPEKLVIQSDHLSDLSTSLLGVFEFNDIFLQVLNRDLLKLWQTKKHVSNPVYGDDFILNENRGYFLFDIKGILELNSYQELRDQELNIRIFHTPIECNFWHFSIRVYKQHIEVKDLDINRKQKKKLWYYVKPFLLEKVYYEAPSHHILTEKNYIAD